MKVLEELKVKNVIISKQAEDSENFQKFKQIVNKRKILVTIVGSNTFDNSKKQNNNSIKNVDIICKEKIQIEKNIYFDFLWPDNQNLLNENALNNNSIVTKLYYNNFSYSFLHNYNKNHCNKEYTEQK